MSAAQRARGEVIAKAPLVLAGIDLFVEVFRLLDVATEAEILSTMAKNLPPDKSPRAYALPRARF